MSPVALLNDVTLCTGCEACVAACKKENNLGPDRRRRQTARIDDLSATRYTTIKRVPGGRYVRQQCRHCLEPACVSACLVGAMYQPEKNGPVIYNKKKCMGCRYCMVACPFKIPRYDWDSPVPGVHKCILCYDRLREGRVPACVEACPEKATIFGDREAVLAEANARKARNPNLRIYGQRDVGGTLVLYVSDIDLGFLEWRPDLDNKEEPLPDRTRAALVKVPPIAVGMAGLMAGIYWVIGRRMRLQAVEAAAAQPAAGEPRGQSGTEESEESE